MSVITELAETNATGDPIVANATMSGLLVKRVPRIHAPAPKSPANKEVTKCNRGKGVRKSRGIEIGFVNGLIATEPIHVKSIKIERRFDDVLGNPYVHRIIHVKCLIANGKEDHRW